MDHYEFYYGPSEKWEPERLIARNKAAYEHNMELRSRRLAAKTEMKRIAREAFGEESLIYRYIDKYDRGLRPNSSPISESDIWAYYKKKEEEKAKKKLEEKLSDEGREYTERCIRYCVEHGLEWSLKTAVNRAHEHHFQELLKEYPEGTELDLEGCDECSTWVVGYTRCSCGNRRVELEAPFGFNLDTDYLVPVPY